MENRGAAQDLWCCKHAPRRLEDLLVNAEMEDARTQSESSRAGLSNEPRNCVQLLARYEAVVKLDEVVSDLMKRVVKPKSPSLLQFEQYVRRLRGEVMKVMGVNNIRTQPLNQCSQFGQETVVEPQAVTLRLKVSKAESGNGVHIAARKGSRCQLSGQHGNRPAVPHKPPC